VFGWVGGWLVVWLLFVVVVVLFLKQSYEYNLEWLSLIIFEGSSAV
jgi:hypothetical protein